MTKLSSSFASLAALLLATSLTLGGCASESTPADGVESSEAALNGAQRLDFAPTADAVVASYLELTTAALDRAKGRHPEVTRLTKDNLETFTEGEGALDTALGTFFHETGTAGLVIGDVAVKFNAFAAGKIRAAAGPDGTVGHTLAEVPVGLSSYFSKARDGLARDKMRTGLKSSDGIAIPTLLDEWSRIERFADVSFGDPYKVSANASVATILRAIGLEDLEPTITGDAAVDSFVRTLEESGGKFTGTLAGMWKSDSVKKQFVFEYGEDGIGGMVLVIVDEHGQLLSFTIHFEA